MVYQTERTGARGRPRQVALIDGRKVSTLAASLLRELREDADTREASNTALAARLNVSRNSIVKALAELEAVGLVARSYTRLNRTVELTTPQGACLRASTRWPARFSRCAVESGW